MMIAMVTVIDHQTKLVFLNSLGYCAPFHHWFSYEPNDQVFNYLDCCGVSPVKKPSFAQSSNVIIKIIKRFGVVYFKLSPSKKKKHIVTYLVRHNSHQLGPSRNVSLAKMHRFQPAAAQGAQGLLQNGLLSTPTASTVRAEGVPSAPSIPWTLY